MKNEFSEINDKLEKLEGSFLENLGQIAPLEFSDIKNDVQDSMHQVEYSTCGCYSSCGSNYSRNGKCSCYNSCGSNYNKG